MSVAAQAVLQGVFFSSRPLIFHSYAESRKKPKPALKTSTTLESLLGFAIRWLSKRISQY